MDKNHDHLCLAGNNKVHSMLDKNGTKGETVKFSDFVIKINRKKKEQTRCILITSKAVYNLMSNNYSKCKRRMPLEDIKAITTSNTSKEFVLHIPDAYDYRYKSAKKNQIAKLLTTIEPNITHKKTDEECLNELAVTKQAARMESREAKYLRSNALAAQDADSDNEDRDEVKASDEKKDTVTSMLQHDKRCGWRTSSCSRCWGEARSAR